MALISLTSKKLVIKKSEEKDNQMRRIYAVIDRMRQRKT